MKLNSTRRWVWVGVGLFASVVGLWFLALSDADRLSDSDSGPPAKFEGGASNKGVVTQSGTPSAQVFLAERPAFQLPPDERFSSLPPHPEAEELGGSSLEAADEPRVVLRVFQAYREAFGSYPPGEDNAQLMRALRGGNPEKRRLFPSENPRLDAAGELLDGFGTPYFFHQISSQEMEVRSAGEDREFYTLDDVVAADRAK